jgi:tetratricopeptide (TPR) repeat protein
MSSNTTAKLTESRIQDLLSNPNEIVRIFVSAIKENQWATASEFAITFGEIFYNSGAAETSLALTSAYLTKWGKNSDQITAEIMILAAHAASHLAKTEIAETYLTQLIELADQRRWPTIHRRALQSLGVLRHNQGRFKERDQLYQRALRIAVSSGDQLGEAQIYNNLGASALAAGDTIHAEQYLRKSISLKHDTGNHADAAGTLVTLGGVLAQTKRWKEARIILKSAIRIASRYRDRGVLSLAYYNLGNLSSDVGNPQDAPRLMRIALKYADMASDVYSQRLCTQGLAVMCHRLKRNKESAKYFTSLIKLTQKLGDARGTALAHHDLGSALALTGRHEEAQIEYKKALDQFTSIRDTTWRVQSLLSLAKITAEANAIAPLLRQIVAQMVATPEIEIPISEVTNLSVKFGLNKIAQDSLAIERVKLTNEELFGRIAALSALASHQRNWALAEIILAESFDQQMKAPWPEFTGKIWNDLGIAQLEQGKQQKAMESFRLAFKLSKRLRNRDLLSQSAHNIGETYRRSGSYTQAIKYLSRSITAAKEIGDSESQAKSLHSLGLAYCDTGANRLAQRTFHKVRIIGIRLKNQFHVAQAAMGLGITSFKLENFRMAIAQFQDAESVFSKLQESQKQIFALYNIGITYVEIGERRRGNRLLMQCANLASNTSDWSMLSLASQRISGLAAENGDANKSAEATALALLAAVATENRPRDYGVAVQSFYANLRMLSERKIKTADEFLYLVLTKLESSPSAELKEMIKKNLNEVVRISKGTTTEIEART